MSSSCAAFHRLLFIDLSRDGQEFGSDQTWWDVNWIRKDVDKGSVSITLIPDVFNEHSLFRYLEANERMAEEAMEKLMLPRVVSHISMSSQSIV